MKSVVITGASGFIGRHAVPLLLEKGYEVHCITSGSNEMAGTGKAIWHQADLMNHVQCDQLFKEIKPSHLLHFAWYTEPGRFWSSDRNLDWTKASIDLLRSFHNYGGKRVIMAGTCAEYEWRSRCYQELTTPLQPATLYGVCKDSLRRIAAGYCRQNDLSMAWGRVFWLFGPYEHPARLVPSVILSLLQSKEARLTHGNQIRDFLHSADVASAFVALLDSPVEGPVNIASGEPSSIKELATLIGKMTGREDLLRFGALSAPSDEPPVIVADVQRLREEVGWKPSFTLESRLEQTIEWWRQHMPDQ